VVSVDLIVLWRCALGDRIILSRITTALVLFITLFLNGCKNVLPTAGPTLTRTIIITPTTPEVELAFETIERADIPGTGGEYQGRDPKMSIITRIEEIDALGDTISLSAQDELRKLDFNQYFVIAIFQGLKGTNMYGVDIQQVTKSGNTITIFAHFTERNPELAAAAVNTSPYHVVKVQKDGLQGEFDFFLNVDGEVILKVPSTL
jgi:PrcB C-terminal